MVIGCAFGSGLLSGFRGRVRGVVGSSFCLFERWTLRFRFFSFPRFLISAFCLFSWRFLVIFVFAEHLMACRCDGLNELCGRQDAFWRMMCDCSRFIYQEQNRVTSSSCMLCILYNRGVMHSSLVPDVMVI